MSVFSPLLSNLGSGGNAEAWATGMWLRLNDNRSTGQCLAQSKCSNAAKVKNNRSVNITLK